MMLFINIFKLKLSQLATHTPTIVPYKAEARVRCVVEISQFGGNFLAKFEGYPAIIGIINMKLTSRLYILSAID